MDCFDIKVEKANANLRYKRIEKITAMFRFMEVCIFLFIISRLSTHLPLAFKVCGECIRALSIAIFSPGFLFILGNAIVLVLFLKSDKLTAQETKNINHTIEFCNEYVENCGNKMNINQVEEVKKQGKQGKQGKFEETEGVLDLCSFDEDRKIHRSKSENVMRYQHQDSCRKLRRTVTGNCRKTENYSKRSDVAMMKKRNSEQSFNHAEDEMSGEEFRHKVEAFIARQQRSLREEFSSIVTYET